MPLTKLGVSDSRGKDRPTPGLRLRCPGCRKAEVSLAAVEPGGWACPGCGFFLKQDHGILRALPAERCDYYARFAEEYLTVRRDEGCGSREPEHYLELPFADTTGRHSDRWKLRARTYRHFERKVLPALERELPGGMDVLDLGAGVGWLSHRLARRGHRPVAVDLLDDSLDGLAAATHYHNALGKPFPLLQAEFDNLPVADSQFDLAIFNASFHYATDYRETLREVRRCLRWASRVAVLDTPLYERYEHGETVREERKRDYHRHYGFRSDSVPSMDYVDRGMLAELSKDLNLRWKVYRPSYGWRNRFELAKARLRRRRPARFLILLGSWTKT